MQASDVQLDHKMIWHHFSIILYYWLALQVDLVGIEEALSFYLSLA